MDWPEWWDWESELIPHLMKRMQDRCFSELDLRIMMEEAIALREESEPGRWVVETRYGSQRWEVIVEPDVVARSLIVITAYRLGQP
jgi:hypothetical protein